MGVRMHAIYHKSKGLPKIYDAIEPIELYLTHKFESFFNVYLE